jgi:hypothetical protein
VLPVVGDRQRVLGRLQPELQPQHAALVLVPHHEPGVLEDPQHPAVRGQHVGDEPGDAPFPRGRGDVLQEHRAEPAALVGVLDVEGHLGLVVGGALVADHADHLVPDGGDQRHPVRVVDHGEPLDVPVGEPPVEREEPEVDRLVGQPRVEAEQPVRVVRPDRPQVCGAAVPEDDIGLPVLRVAAVVHDAEASHPAGGHPPGGR